MKCPKCSLLLTPSTACPSVVKKGGFCRKCHTIRSRVKYGCREQNRQHPGETHIFLCGCSGVLPKEGRSNVFACWMNRSFICRVSKILASSRNDGRKRGYVSVDSNTPHSDIRKLMDRSNCERCRKVLSWDNLMAGHTPHLHHSHVTGEIYGFTHPHCNPQAMEREIELLRDDVKRLKQ